LPPTKKGPFGTEDKLKFCAHNLQPQKESVHLRAPECITIRNQKVERTTGASKGPRDALEAVKEEAAGNIQRKRQKTKRAWELVLPRKRNGEGAHAQGTCPGRVVKPVQMLHRGGQSKSMGATIFSRQTKLKQASEKKTPAGSYCRLVKKVLCFKLEGFKKNEGVVLWTLEPRDRKFSVCTQRKKARIAVVPTRAKVTSDMEGIREGDLADARQKQKGNTKKKRIPSVRKNIREKKKPSRRQLTPQKKGGC